MTINTSDVLKIGYFINEKLKKSTTYPNLILSIKLPNAPPIIIDIAKFARRLLFLWLRY